MVVTVELEMVVWWILKMNLKKYNYVHWQKINCLLFTNILLLSRIVEGMLSRHWYHWIYILYMHIYCQCLWLFFTRGYRSLVWFVFFFYGDFSHIRIRNRFGFSVISQILPSISRCYILTMKIFTSSCCWYFLEILTTRLFKEKNQWYLGVIDAARLSNVPKKTGIMLSTHRILYRPRVEDEKCGHASATQ